MNRDNDSDNDHDYPTAVAAAAYAVHSLEEYSKAITHNETTYAGPDVEPFTNKMKSNPKQKSSKDSDIEVPTISASTSKKMPEKGVDPSVEKASQHSPYIGRPSTNSADKQHLNTNDSKSPKTPLPDDRSSVTTDQPVEDTTSQLSAIKPGTGDSMADAWEKNEITRNKERYVRLRITINNWEFKKKKEADLKLETRKAKIPDKKRAKAVRSHHNEIKRIEEVAKGARVDAEAKCRKRELKVKKKADKIRTTGKLPAATCLCC